MCVRTLTTLGGSQVHSGDESACKSRSRRRCGLIPRSGRSPGGENGNPLQYVWLENPRDRGVWQATVHDRLSMHAAANCIIALYF